MNRGFAQPSNVQRICAMMNIYWHRLFGLLLMDYLSNRGFRVELEKDLSLKRQHLDVVIVEREDEEPDLSGICDGFDNLSSHNLLSYKSKRQSLNAWALEELIGHYVNYRKVLGRSRTKSDDIRLYAVSTRRPDRLLSMTGATETKPGVWDLRVLSRDIRILVLSGLPLAQRNARCWPFSPSMRRKCDLPWTTTSGRWKTGPPSSTSCWQNIHWRVLPCHTPWNSSGRSM